MMLPRGLLRSSKNNYVKLLKVLPSLLVLVLIFLLLHFFKIKALDCQDGGISCESEFSEPLNKYLQSNSLAIRKSVIKNSLEKIRPITDLELHFKYPNILKISFNSEKKSLPINLILVSEFPLLGFEKIPISSEEAVFFQKPSIELGTIPRDQVESSFVLWPDGNLTGTATGEASVRLYFKQKPEKETLINIYKIIEIIKRRLPVDQIYGLGSTIFLSVANQPDIITSVPYDEGRIMEALQSLDFLTTMKSNPKIIDLRYKNPTIR